MVRKLFFAVAWLGILFLSLMGIYLAIFPKYILNFNLEGIVFRGATLGVAVFYLLIFIEKFLMNFEKSKDYQVQTENGKLTVSSSSINNLVREVVLGNPDLKNIKAKNKIKGKKLYITVTVDAYSDSDIARNISDTQGRIKHEIFEYLSLEVEEVEVKVSKLLKRRGSSILAERGEE
ncbi:hypothetical protein PM10SUCC1_14980 [Propionigenium maris DSM 9537]|uniref:Alkaline shock response membrane anchor protein AmaP n=1 Tax=Propionigenium maris DSM 9537 TaxID=1123000 RepID=A0A9W6LMM8_9FUSO|nr:alkaline shock response membrane anchor protein AmaP [Propionigenium maris]GLI55984.1 hypothetical protein PM10SUCC1_14980 [Propionigenium maris DSM 9537]